MNKYFVCVFIFGFSLLIHARDVNVETPLYRMTHGAFSYLEEHYKRKKEAGYGNLVLVETFGASYEQSDGAQVDERIHSLMIGGFGDEIPEDRILINILDMEFYVSESTRRMMSRSVLERVVVISADGKAFKEQLVFLNPTPSDVDFGDPSITKTKQSK